MSAGLEELDWVQLPKDFYLDGLIEMAIAKTAGQSDAMVSQPGFLLMK